MRRVVGFVLVVTGVAAADSEPPPLVDPWEEATPPAPVVPPEPKREDPKPAKATDPTNVAPSLHMRTLPYVTKRPAKPDYQDAPFSGDPEPDAHDVERSSPEPVYIPYPRSFVLRPLVLPDKMASGSIGSRVGRETFGDVRLLYLQGYASGVFGRDGYEIFASVTLNVTSNDNLPGDAKIDLPFFQAIAMGAAFELTRTTALGLQGVVGNLDGHRRYSPSVFVNHKLELSDRNSIVVGGDLDYNYGNENDGTMDIVTHRLGAYAGVVGRTQPTENFAMQLSGTVAYFKYVDGEHPKQDTFHNLSAGLAFLFSVSERMDVALYTSLSTSDDVDGGAVGLTLTKR